MKKILTTKTLLLVLIIIALIPQIDKGRKRMLKRAKSYATKQKISGLNTRLDQFKKDTGFYPDTDYWLHHLIKDYGTENWNGPYLRKESVPKDPWGNDFRYDLINGIPIVISSGKDGKFETSYASFRPPPSLVLKMR